MESENQTSPPLSTRELRYERLWEEFRKLRNAQSQVEHEVALDGILWDLAEKVTYNDEGA